ncbi:MAG: SDR family oxidoreductase [Myxococcota bacterium]
MQTKTIIITGSSRGLGAYLLSEFEGAGHRVYGLSRRGGDRERDLAADVTDAQSVQAAVDTVMKREGRVDVLINNAGSHLLGAVLETSDDELRAQLELNFHGAVHMVQAVLPSMLEHGDGRIINMSSVGGRLATPFTSAYSASKFALEGWMEALQLELTKTGVFVTNLEPGFLKTGTTDRSVIPTRGEHPRFSTIRRTSHERMLQDATKGLPLEAVARQMQAIIDATAPSFRYSIDGLLPRLRIAQMLMPERWFQRFVIRATAPALAEG